MGTFADERQLQEALAEWAASSGAARLKHGAIESWNVSAVTSMNDLLNLEEIIRDQPDSDHLFVLHELRRVFSTRMRLEPRDID